MPNKSLIFFIFLFSFCTFANVSEECKTALTTLFANKISKSEAEDFLKVQGDLTLHRMAWAYLKAQKNDQSKTLENVERTILTLLDEKYTSTDPNFKKARDLFESQPLSRTALAEISPFLKEALAKNFAPGSEAFLLNASDLKLLHALSTFEARTPKKGKYDSRMLSNQSPQGMLNFMKLINSSYKTSNTDTEEALNVELKLQGIEKTIRVYQEKMNKFFKHLDLPNQCQFNSTVNCKKDGNSVSEVFRLNEDVQNILWDVLSQKLITDDSLLDQLTFGKVWLKAGKQSSPITPVSLKRPPDYFPSAAPILKEFYSSTLSDFYIEDPLKTILKDGGKKNPEAIKKDDPVYLNKFADAVVNNYSLFEINGELYDRKTGELISVDDALKLLPPKSSKNFSNTLYYKDPIFLAKQVAAKVNDEQTFIFKSQLYSTNGTLLNSEEIINKEMAKKGYGTGENFKPSLSDLPYLVARANSLKNNKPHFKYNNQEYDTETGLNLSSPFRSAFAPRDVKISKERRGNYDHFSDKETIINFHKDKPSTTMECQYYSIIDKKNADITVYSLAGLPVFHKEVLVGINVSDERTKWAETNEREHFGSKTTGAGAFTIAEPKTGDYYSKIYSNNLLQIEGQAVFAIHQVPNNLPQRYKKFGTSNPEDRRVSQGCVNMKQSEFLELAKWMKPSCKVYVLPEEANNKFIVKEGKIAFTSTTAVANPQKYNYSSNGAAYKEIKIHINNPAGKTPDSLLFTKTLETEKAKLMKLFNLNNDDYNDLALIAYGIMGQESNFGNSPRYMLKENAQPAVVLVKAARTLFNGEDPFVKSTANTSRGFTQIKYLPDGAWREAYPEISKETLGNPKNSAIATIAYLVGAVRTLRSISVENKLDPNKVRITKENMMDYVAYIYQGHGVQLKSATSNVNPDMNTYVQSLRKNMSYIEISQSVD